MLNDAPETKLFSIQNVVVFNKFSTSIKYQSFKYFWKARQNWDRTVIWEYFFVIFFVYWDYFSYFKTIWNFTSY